MSTNANANIYDLHEVAVDLQKQYIPHESDRTRAIGIYGYMADAHANQMQNSIIVASEMGNELWPARARFEKNVISHAISYGISNINATPATMRVYIGIPEKTIYNLLENDIVTLDKESKFNIGQCEFHLQYDLKIQRHVIENNEIVYSALYNMDRHNELSYITNPYLNAPFIQYLNDDRYLLLECELMQVEHSSVSRKVLTNNAIENKTFEFEFDDQLASFEVRVTESGKVTYLTPIFEESSIDQTLENFCYYSYIEANRIKVTFDSLSYIPSMNAQVEVLIKTTRGASGNFEYNTNIFTSINSDTYGYKNLSVYVMVASDSRDGKDRKSIDVLRKELPKEALSRGSIANTQDLLNYFNTFASEFVRLQIQKKVDNQLERTYFAHMVMKDSYNNIIPTNTINLRIYDDSEFDTIENRKRVLKPGCIIGLNDEGTEGHIINPTDKDGNINPEYEEYLKDNNKFLYTVPLMTTVTDDPLYVSYYKTLMHYSALLDFEYINMNSPVQFISTGIVWRRGYNINPDKYLLDISFTQNILTNKNIITENDAGDMLENSLKVIAVFYNTGDDTNIPYRYSVADIVNYDINSTFSYDYRFELKTTDQLNDDSKIKITNTYDIGKDTIWENSYFTGDVNVKIYVLAKFENGEYGRHDLDSIVPGLEGYTVTNVYKVNGGVKFFENFSNIISSYVSHRTPDSIYETQYGFYIKSIPVIKLSYADDEENLQELINQMIEAKAYIDQGILKLENNFDIDFKFFNTYGPSKIYSLDKNGNEIIDRVNLTLKFEIKLTKTADRLTRDYIAKDIKDMVENLNNLTHLHIPNLITEITNKYRPNSIEYIEFKGFNEYGATEQHLYRQEYDDITIVPEFLSINTTDELTADIKIDVV